GVLEKSRFFLYSSRAIGDSLQNARPWELREDLLEGAARKDQIRRRSRSTSDRRRSLAASRRRLPHEQHALPLRAPPLAARAAVGSPRAVAGDDDGGGVGGAGAGHRAGGAWVAERACDFRVAARLAARDRPQLLPHPALEGGGLEVEGKLDRGRSWLLDPR